MKKIIKILSITVFLIMSTALISTLNAQPNPGQNGNGGSVGGPPIGGGAPLGGGIIILAVMAVGYGAKKLYNARKEFS